MSWPPGLTRFALAHPCTTVYIPGEHGSRRPWCPRHGLVSSSHRDEVKAKRKRSRLFRARLTCSQALRRLADRIEYGY